MNVIFFTYALLSDMSLKFLIWWESYSLVNAFFNFMFQSKCGLFFICVEVIVISYKFLSYPCHFNWLLLSIIRINIIMHVYQTTSLDSTFITFNYIYYYYYYFIITKWTINEWISWISFELFIHNFILAISVKSAFTGGNLEE